MTSWSEIWHRDYSAPALLLAGAVLLPLAIWTRSGVLAGLFAILAFTAFDLLGFGGLCDEGKSERLPYYRILQTSFQIVLTGFVWMVGGISAALGFAVIWWTGGCDLLYYALGRYLLWQGSWTWLWWTPVGLIMYAIAGWTRDRIALPLELVFLQALAGIGITVWIFLR